MIKSIQKLCAVVGAFALVGQASIALAAEGAVGEWELNIDVQGQSTPVALDITEEDGVLTGTIASDLGEYPITEVSFEDGVLKFNLDLADQGFSLSFEATIEGNKIKGNFNMPDIGEIPVSGTRGGLLISVAGTYDLMVASALGNNARTLVINDDMTGTYGGGDFDDFPISNVKLEGNRLTLDVTLQVQGNELPSKITLAIDGDEVTGNLDFGQGVATITGKRASAPSIIGTWAMAGVSDATGDIERTWIFNEDMTGTYEGDIGSFPITDVKVDGADVTFKVVLDVQGQELPSTFTGKLENGKLVGELDFGFGSAAFEGEQKE